MMSRRLAAEEPDLRSSCHRSRWKVASLHIRGGLGSYGKVMKVLVEGLAETPETVCVEERPERHPALRNETNEGEALARLAEVLEQLGLITQKSGKYDDKV